MTKFEESVYKITAQIPKGKVTTYKIIAEILKTSPRAVGNALAKNPYAPKVPCHRVIRSDLKIGGFNGQKDNPIKEQMLLQEGMAIDDHKISNIANSFYSLSPILRADSIIVKPATTIAIRSGVISPS